MYKLLVCILFFNTLIFSYDINYIKVDKIIRVYDGDTIYVDIYSFHPLLGDNIGIRLKGIDTPELRNKKTKKRSLELKHLLYKKLNNCKHIYLKNMKRGKYFRIVADVYCEEENINEYMLKQPDVYEYHGGKKRKL